MTREQATQVLKAGKLIELISRDATGTCFTHTAVWLSDEGHLVMAHPTRDVGTTLVLDCQLESLVFA